MGLSLECLVCQLCLTLDGNKSLIILVRTDFPLPPSVLSGLNNGGWTGIDHEHGPSSSPFDDDERRQKAAGRPSLLSPEVSGFLELSNVWVFVQLFFCPHWPMNQLNKNPNIA